MSHPKEDAGPRGNRLDEVDALRGLAALAVGYFHMTLSLLEQGQPLSPGEGTLMWLFTGALDSGKIAVVVFFAISGLIVPVSLSRGGDAPVRRFLFSRFFRLYPPYWLSLVLCLLLVPPVAEGAYSPGSVLANLSMVQGFLGFRDINGVAWTLQIELVFYALCLGLFLVGRLDSARAQLACLVFFLLCALVLAALRFHLARKLPVALPLALAVMFFGCLWRGAVVERATEARRLLRPALLAWAVLLPAICVLGYSRSFGYDETWHRYLVTYVLAMAVFMLCTTRFPITWKPLVAVGAVSYSVYLLHAPVWWALMLLGLKPFPIPYGAHLFIALVLAATVLAGWAAHRWVEKPMIALGRRLGGSRPKPRDAPAVALADNVM